MATIPCCTSDKSKILDNKTGPNSDTVARILVPFCSDIDSISIGNFLASKGKPIFAWRSSIFGCPGLGCAKPDKSPLISINKTGIPLSDNVSAKTCRVFVFPVPVAPAIKPCLFRVFKGIFTIAFVTVSSPNIAAPSSI